MGLDASSEQTYYRLLMGFTVTLAILGLVLFIITIISFKDTHKSFVAIMCLISLYMIAVGIGLSVVLADIQSYLQPMINMPPPPQPMLSTLAPSKNVTPTAQTATK